jgi:methyl-accepting chemotaxis protein
MTATLTVRVEEIADGVKRVADLAEQLARAAVDLTEQWEHDTVQEMARVSFRAQDTADEVREALNRLQEVVR